MVQQVARRINNVICRSVESKRMVNADNGAVAPTTLIGEMFFNKDNKKAAWETGRHSAEVALTGIYKVFVMIASPKYMIDRASKILVTFYEPTSMEVIEIRPKGVTLQITRFPHSNTVLEHRIGGWIEKALEICGCNILTVKITKALSSGEK